MPYRRRPGSRLGFPPRRQSPRGRDVGSQMRKTPKRLREGSQGHARGSHVDPRCPCGSGKEYASCCQPHHDGTAPADAVTPENIVRARFSAYVKNAPKYIVASTHPDSKDMKRKDDPAEAREQLEKDADATMKKVNFTSLRVKAIKEGDEETFVTYEVSYKGAGKKNRGGTKTLAERSRYKKADGEFKYFDALPLNSSSDMNAVGQI
jgi:uncharacterized protein YchJ